MDVHVFLGHLMNCLQDSQFQFTVSILSFDYQWFLGGSFFYEIRIIILRYEDEFPVKHLLFR